jgi:hypothetical protein
VQTVTSTVALSCRLILSSCQKYPRGRRGAPGADSPLLPIRPAIRFPNKLDMGASQDEAGGSMKRAEIDAVRFVRRPQCMGLTGIVAGSDMALQPLSGQLVCCGVRAHADPDGKFPIHDFIAMRRLATHGMEHKQNITR